MSPLDFVKSDVKECGGAKGRGKEEKMHRRTRNWHWGYISSQDTQIRSSSTMIDIMKDWI